MRMVKKVFPPVFRNPEVGHPPNQPGVNPFSLHDPKKILGESALAKVCTPVEFGCRFVRVHSSLQLRPPVHVRFGPWRGFPFKIRGQNMSRAKSNPRNPKASFSPRSSRPNCFHRQIGFKRMVESRNLAGSNERLQLARSHTIASQELVLLLAVRGH